MSHRTRAVHVMLVQFGEKDGSVTQATDDSVLLILIFSCLLRGFLSIHIVISMCHGTFGSQNERFLVN